MITSLFDIDDIKRRSFLHGNINDDQLNVLIERTQDSYIQNLLGTGNYVALQLRKQSGTLTAVDNELINNYLLPCFVIKIEARAIVDYNIDYRNLTVGSVIDSQIQPLTIDQVKFYLNQKDLELTTVEKMAIDFILANYGNTNDCVVKQKKDNSNNIYWL